MELFEVGNKALVNNILVSYRTVYFLVYESLSLRIVKLVQFSCRRFRPKTTLFAVLLEVEEKTVPPAGPS